MSMTMTKPKTSKVVIRYKSGIEVNVTVTKFTAFLQNGILESVTYKGMTPNPLFINVNEIESIWEIV
jgi:hypothetical protein